MMTLGGVSPTMLTVGLVALTGGVLLIVAGLAAGTPLLWRMGRRNMVRRPSQTLILLSGLVLSTVFVTASFGLQDSFDHSQAAYRLTQMGNVDEAVSGPLTPAQVTGALARLRQMPEVQAATAILVNRLAAEITVARNGLTTAGVDLYAVPPAFDQVYGPLTDDQGQRVSVADLRPNEVLVSATLARTADIRAGDTIQVTLGGQTAPRRVRAILSHDMAVTTGELDFDGSYAELVLPLATVQQGFGQRAHEPLLPNTLCIKNVGQGGMDDIGPGGSRSQRVTQVLEQIFRAAPDARGTIPTPYTFTIVHPLKPQEVEAQGAFNPIAGKGAVISSPAARQFTFLLPAFTALLVAAGLLLLVLLVLLLAAERRAELGMSRAIGLQRSHLVQALLIEGGGYGAVAAVLGIPLGMGGVTLALSVLSRLPSLSGGPVSPLQPGHVPLHVWLSWQSALSAWSIGVLTTVVVVLGTGLWISRANIVAAIRDLEDPPAIQMPLRDLLRALWAPPCDGAGQPISETPARRRARHSEAVSGLVVALAMRGPACLLVGCLILAQGQDQDWLSLLGVALLIAGIGLHVRWLVPLLPIPMLTPAVAHRLGVSLIGLGWISYGLPQNSFLFAFEPIWNRLPSVQADLLSMLMPLAGVVGLVMANADGVVRLLTLLMRRVRSLAPVGRISLIYPLTFRVRTGVTVALLSLMTFLIMLLVTTNLSLVQQQGQMSVTTGGFQLEMVLGEDDNRALAARIRATPRTLRREVAAVTLMRYQYGIYGDSTKPIRLLLPAQPPFAYRTPAGPTVADATYLSLTTMPVFAHARGYSSDRQVWDAVRDHPGDAVLRYDNRIPGLPSSNGFAPVTAEVPASGDPGAAYHRVTIIGLVPATSHWPGILLSTRTAAAMGARPSTGVNFYDIRLQRGVRTAQASTDLNRALQLGRHGIQVTALDAAEATAYTANLTLFLGGYLALGLLFGALAITVIVSRAVVERRQQIGMLRALGFSRALVRRSFLLEAGFVITLSLATGTGLAGWLAAQVARQGSPGFPLPLGPMALLLLGSYLVAALATVMPARRAARLPPAEALRYE